VTIKLGEQLWLVAALVRNALLRYLVGLERPVLNYDPVTFIDATISFARAFRRRSPY